MGVTDKFAIINEELRRELGYHLDPEKATDFRSLVHRAGVRRVKHCISIVKLEGRRGASAHPRLRELIWVHMPAKKAGTKYRNPFADTRAMNLAQRREFEYAMALDGE